MARHGQNRGDAGPAEGATAARLRRLFEAATAAPETFEALATALVDELSDDARAGDYLEAALPLLRGAAPDGHPQDGEGLTLGRDGVVLSVGGAARRRLGIAPGDGLVQLGIGAPDLDALQVRIARHPARRGILSIWPTGVNRPQFLLAGQQAPGEPLALVPFEMDWPEALDETLAQIFGLSRREQHILRQLYEGHDPQAIADADGRALGTVRQQIKSILAKLGLGNRGRVQAFLAAASIALNPDALSPFTGGEGAAPSDSDLRRARVLVPGRNAGPAPLGLRSFGDPDGAPCLYVHGALFGFGMIEAERQVASALGLHVFGPERRGYGGSPATDWQTLARADGAADLREALDHYLPSGKPAIVLAHDTGLLPALALAMAQPDRVAGLVAVSATPPVLAWADSAGMPPQQRVFSLTMLRAPPVADALVTLGLARMRRLGAESWPEAVFAGVPCDEAVAREPQNLAAVTRAYAFNTEQAARGFRIDMTRLYRDWGDLPARLRCPVVFLHGAQNRTVTAQRLAGFARKVAQAQVEVVADAGHTLALSHPALALRHAFAMAWQNPALRGSAATG